MANELHFPGPKSFYIIFYVFFYIKKKGKDIHYTSSCLDNTTVYFYGLNIFTDRVIRALGPGGVRGWVSFLSVTPH